MNWVVLEDRNRLKQIKNLFKKIIKDEKVYFMQQIELLELFICYIKSSSNMKTKVRRQEFLSILPLLSRKKTSIDCLPCIVSKRPLRLYMKAWQIFVCFSKSAVDPKYCLLAVDLSTSKTFVYPIKSRNLLSTKLELFYRDIQPKREQHCKNRKNESSNRFRISTK